MVGINQTKDQMFIVNKVKFITLQMFRCTPNRHISHWIAASLSLVFLLQILHGKTILVFLEVDVLMILIGN